MHPLTAHLLHLPQDDVALLVDCAGVQVGVKQDVGDDVHRLANVLTHHLRIVAGLLATRVRVQLPAHVLHLNLELLNGALLHARVKQAKASLSPPLPHTTMPERPMHKSCLPWYP